MIASTRCSFFWQKIKRRTISFICLADVGQQFFWWPKKNSVSSFVKIFFATIIWRLRKIWFSQHTHKCNLKWQLVVLCQTSVGWHEALGLLQTVLQLEVVYPLFDTNLIFLAVVSDVEKSSTQLWYFQQFNDNSSHRQCRVTTVVAPIV